MEVGLMKDLVA